MKGYAAFLSKRPYNIEHYISLSVCLLDFAVPTLSQSAMPTSFPISLHPDGIVAFHAPYAIDTPFDVKDTLAVHVEHRDVIAVHRS